MARVGKSILVMLFLMITLYCGHMVQNRVFAGKLYMPFLPSPKKGELLRRL